MEYKGEDAMDKKQEIIDYREESKKLLDEITDDWILRQVYRCIKNITKEE